MPSATKQTEKRREIRDANKGKRKKKARAKGSTPPFPVHPEKADRRD